MKIIVCLGNPGPEYRETRHNAGFIIGQAIADKWSFSDDGSKFKARIAGGLVNASKVILIFPQTFMNLSGQSVVAALQFYKCTLEDLLVIYDDFDIPLGTIRFRTKGSAGTHNGMKSIVQLLGSSDFARLRIGIGPKYPNMSVSDFVLARFKSDERKILDEMIPDSQRCIAAWAVGDTDLATRTAAQTGSNTPQKDTEQNNT
ncbi:aminoacyl-tRNA hydrolase [bacterium]|nr:aminoacyl-tRNA hydrolase [bacterium]